MNKEIQKPQSHSNNKRAKKKQLKVSDWLDGTDVKTTFNISESTLARYRKSGDIPYAVFGKKYLYPKSFFEKSLVKKIVNAHLM